MNIAQVDFLDPNIDLSTLKTPIVLFAKSVDGKAEIISTDPRFAVVQTALDAFAAKGCQDELTKLWPGSELPLVFVAGIGAERTANTLRYASGSVTRQISGYTGLVFADSELSEPELTASIEGALIGSYRFDKYKKSAANSRLKTLIFTSALASNIKTSATKQATIVATAIATVKNLVNTPANDLYPSALADFVTNAVAELPITVKVWDEDALKTDGFGGISGVGMGSARPPRLVKLDYNPANSSKHIALVGKGITFDTGGLSLKPAASMVGMKYDMTGSATVFAVIKAIAELELPVHVTAWLCIAENMPGGNSLRPNDVLTIHGGKTVEVMNTDAEGRLVLADGIVAAGTEKPDYLIDVATLTGAARVALGNRYTAILGDDAFVSTVIDSANTIAEPFWQLPLADELRQNLDSEIADIANAKIGSPAGGTIVGALFLRDFVNQVKEQHPELLWAHLDIASGASSDTGYGFTGKGATGVAIRTLLHLAGKLN